MWPGIASLKLGSRVALLVSDNSKTRFPTSRFNAVTDAAAQVWRGSQHGARPSMWRVTAITLTSSPVRELRSFFTHLQENPSACLQLTERSQ